MNRSSHPRSESASYCPDRKTRIFFWCLAIAIGFLQAWAYRQEMNPDGISYIEMAWAGTHAGWHSFVNGVWSPLYPFLLSGIFRAFHPSMSEESTVVHLVNFFIYLINLACFEIFLRELLRRRAEAQTAGGGKSQISPRLIWIFGYLFFIWAYQHWLNLALVVPDLLVAALGYLATWALLRIRAGGNRRSSWSIFVFLGVVLGVAYLAKTAMFLVGIIFLACAFFAADSVASALPRVGVSFIIFLAIAAPLTVGLTQDENHLTIGESGKFNYAIYIDGAARTNWQGAPPGTGVPEHPTREINFSPAMYEFATPVGGSYPPWYQPTYWYAGITPHFLLKGQLRALFTGANFYLQMFSRNGVLYVTLVALFVLVKGGGRWTSGSAHRWTVWLPSYAALALYAMVHVEPRYIGGFALMLVMGLLAGVRFGKVGRSLEEARVAPQARISILAIILAPALAIAWFSGACVIRLIGNKPPVSLRIADALHEMGAHPDASIGTINSGAGAYWAHLAGVRIIAEIPDQNAFWASDAATQSQLEKKFSSAGVTLIVSSSPPSARSTEGWRCIAGTTYSVRFISSTGPSADAPVH